MLKNWRVKTSQERQRPVLKKAFEDEGFLWLAEKNLGARKRRINTSPGPAKKRPKVTESGPNPKAKSPGNLPNVTKKKATTMKASTEKATTKKATPNEATTKKATTEKATTKKATTEKATTKKVTPKKATTKKATPNEATTKKATTKKATTKKATTKKATTNEAITKKATREKATTKRATTKKATPKKATTKKATTKKATTKKATTKKATTKKATTKKATTKKATREKAIEMKATKKMPKARDVSHHVTKQTNTSLTLKHSAGINLSNCFETAHRVQPGVKELSLVGVSFPPVYSIPVETKNETLEILKVRAERGNVHHVLHAVAQNCPSLTKLDLAFDKEDSPLEVAHRHSSTSPICYSLRVLELTVGQFTLKNLISVMNVVSASYPNIQHLTIKVKDQYQSDEMSLIRSLQLHHLEDLRFSITGMDSKAEKDLQLAVHVFCPQLAPATSQEGVYFFRRMYGASGYLDHLGGELSISAYNVKLSIPPGALTDREKISIEVFTDLPNGINLQDNEIVASFGFRCFPSGLSFKKPLTLSMPHCAVIDDKEMVGMVLHFRSNDKEKIIRIPLESNKYVIRSDSIELELDHFSLVIPTLTSELISKRMLCTPYIPQTLPNDQDNSIMHLRLYYQLPGLSEDILAEENSLNYKKISPEEQLTVPQHSIDMSISCKLDELTSTQIENISAKELMQCTKRTMYMDLHSRRSFVTLIIKQEHSLKIKFWTDIKDAVHEESDEAAPSGSRPKRKRKPATVHQRGGAKTINASGRSKVKGSTMTGTATKMTVHNHPAEASSSQSRGTKGKTAVSSGGKKRAKMAGTDVASETIHPSRGGTIQLPHYGIKLTIPPLALQKECKITLKVLPQPSSVFFAENEAIISPGVVCEPSGTKFEMPIKLVIPHCAVLRDPSNAKVNMHFTHGDTEVTTKELSSTGTPRCVVTKDVLEVYINHFTKYTFGIAICHSIHNYFIGKRVASTPFLPKILSRLQPCYCRLRLYNDTPGIEDGIKSEEDELDYHKMAPKKKMIVYWRKGELKIICEVDGGYVPEEERIKTVSIQEIYDLDVNYYSFLVAATGDADVGLKFNFYPHCDEGHAFHAKFSGEAAMDTGQAGRSETEALSEPVTVHQRGRDQTINASRRSMVEGNAMTSVIINTGNHPAEASTSQSQGIKRKAAASSGGKKSAKKGRKR